MTTTVSAGRPGLASVKDACSASRADDVVRLPAPGGGEVAVHPIEFGSVTRDRELREFQVLQQGASVRIIVVSRSATGHWLEDRLPDAVSRRLAEIGVHQP